MNLLIKTAAILGIILGASANAWDKPVKSPDATESECKALGKTFVKHSVRKNGVSVRAHCRAKGVKGGAK